MLINAYVYVGGLNAGSDEPVVYTITSSTAIAVGDKVVSLTVTEQDLGKVYIRKGSCLHFETNFIVIAKDTEITSFPTPVYIEPAESAIALSDTAFTWSLQRILAKYIHSNNSKFTITTSDLESRGFGAIIHPASQGSQSIYTLIVQNSRHTFGRAQVGSLFYRDDSAEFELYSQASFVKDVSFAAQSTSLQTTLNDVRKRSGLPMLVAQ